MLYEPSTTLVQIGIGQARQQRAWPVDQEGSAGSNDRPVEGSSSPGDDREMGNRLADDREEETMSYVHTQERGSLRACLSPAGALFRNK